jgi:SAM-dependent methyltransferase
MDSRLYSQFESNWDDSLFRKQISEVLRNEDHLLDLGAGAGIVAQMNFRGQAARVCGIDPDARVCFNPYLDEGKVAVGEDIPYEDAAFDVVIADNVLEHLERPQQVFREVTRVLKPGGFFLAKTPNKHHYMPLIARLTPLRFHQFVNRMRGRENVDTFPTRYRVNTPREIRSHAAKAGLIVREMRLVEGRPEYLRVLAAAYFFGWIYERLVNTLPGLASFRILLIISLQKPST